MPSPRKSEYLVRRTTTRKGTRKMRKSVSELGRFQISLETSSRCAGLAGSRTIGGASEGCTDIRGSGRRSPVQNKRFARVGEAASSGISIRALTFLRLLPRISVPPEVAKVAELVDALVSGASG